jgi:hypothetical protein
LIWSVTTSWTRREVRLLLSARFLFCCGRTEFGVLFPSVKRSGTLWMLGTHNN